MTFAKEAPQEAGFVTYPPFKNARRNNYHAVAGSQVDRTTESEKNVK